MKGFSTSEVIGASFTGKLEKKGNAEAVPFLPIYIHKKKAPRFFKIRHFLKRASILDGATVVCEALGT